MTIQKAKIHKLLNQRILVIGDLMLDRFIYGQVNRISPEAPVPVVHVTNESAFPGGAANVARNLSDFGINVTICGLLGNDPAGHELCQLLIKSNISTQGIITLEQYHTIVKTRIIARHQQVCRVDRESKTTTTFDDRFERVLEKTIRDKDAIIIEDYGKGFITQSLVNSIISIAQKQKIMVTVDPNIQNPLNWQGARVVKPNRQEAYSNAGIPIHSDSTDIEKIGQILLNKWQTPYLLLTLGEEGMILFHPPHPIYHSPTKAREVYDVSGAGDTVIAFFTAALAAGLSGEDAAEIANHAAGIVVGKLGTATLSQKELLESFGQYE